MKIQFNSDYLNMRAQHPREIPEVEARSPALKMRSETNETEKVNQVYRKALNAASKAVLDGSLDQFSATVGDHLCQVASAVIFHLGTDPAIQDEAKQLQKALRSKERLLISPEMNYLLRAHLLNSGQTFSVSREGNRTLKIDPQKAMQALGIKDKTFLATMKQIIDFSKSAMNKETVEAGEFFAMLELPKSEAECVSEVYTKRGEGELMKNPLYFPNAFFITKAALRVFDRMNASLELASYDPQKGFSVMRRGEGAPDVVVHAFFPEGIDPKTTLEKVKRFGFREFLLASIAQEAQFEDLPQESKEGILRTGGDFAHLPEGPKREIMMYRGRELGGLPRITHFTLAQRGAGS